ncbi:MAG: hypothetical protein JO146_06635, partial [Candidatus Eremiobacteraeota bacterium]|nr:hypothetical protein [Candidatus Eremiobacteraeota bacterium]
MILRWAFLFVFCGLAGCGPAMHSSLPPTDAAASFDPLVTGAGKIKHVVYIVQENRSFDDLFQGYPGADTVKSGKDSNGATIALKPVSLKAQYTLDHSAEAMFVDCNGTGNLPGTKCRMNGFDGEANSGGPPGVKYPMYVYVPHNESKPYFDIAHEWVLADKTFASQIDESFVAHQYIIAAQAQSSVDVPLARWGCQAGQYDYVHILLTDRRISYYTQKPCFNYETLGDELDDAHLSWHFYTSRYTNGSSGGGSFWSSYQAVYHIYNGPDWKKVITPQKTFLTDVAHGKLASFTWITPTCFN